ncbi:hypothetical protein BCR34DRAFT_360296 [Clohesyomyces aquaticus]|uniref:Uncharacterized protein n=1 Tax=Clohesyomyces aquaticus TaxID=1231657 RepID=A0A1Y2A7X8_9PLEO|nr:hypothetical protein BCR34DRAFT_360296 [Clohesyomyces aquaticus]
MWRRGCQGCASNHSANARPLESDVVLHATNARPGPLESLFIDLAQSRTYLEPSPHPSMFNLGRCGRACPLRGPRYLRPIIDAQIAVGNARAKRWSADGRSSTLRTRMCSGKPFPLTLQTMPLILLNRPAALARKVGTLHLVVAHPPACCRRTLHWNSKTSLPPSRALACTQSGRSGAPHTHEIINPPHPSRCHFCVAPVHPPPNFHLVTRPRRIPPWDLRVGRRASATFSSSVCTGRDRPAQSLQTSTMRDFVSTWLVALPCPEISSEGHPPLPDAEDDAGIVREPHVLSRGSWDCRLELSDSR